MPHARLAALLDARTSDGKTALALATIRGDRQAVGHLCLRGADVDAADATAFSTPLHWAGAIAAALLPVRLADTASASTLCVARRLALPYGVSSRALAASTSQ